jgi:hypothetical protein
VTSKNKSPLTIRDIPDDVLYGSILKDLPNKKDVQNLLLSGVLKKGKTNYFPREFEGANLLTSPITDELFDYFTGFLQYIIDNLKDNRDDFHNPHPDRVYFEYENMVHMVVLCMHKYKEYGSNEEDDNMYEFEDIIVDLHKKKLITEYNLLAMQLGFWNFTSNTMTITNKRALDNIIAKGRKEMKRILKIANPGDILLYGKKKYRRWSRRSDRHLLENMVVINQYYNDAHVFRRDDYHKDYRYPSFKKLKTGELFVRMNPIEIEPYEKNRRATTFTVNPLERVGIEHLAENSMYYKAPMVLSALLPYQLMDKMIDPFKYYEKLSNRNLQEFAVIQEDSKNKTLQLFDNNKDLIKYGDRTFFKNNSNLLVFQKIFGMLTAKSKFFEYNNLTRGSFGLHANFWDKFFSNSDLKNPSQVLVLFSYSTIVICVPKDETTFNIASTLGDILPSKILILQGDRYINDDRRLRTVTHLNT